MKYNKLIYLLLCFVISSVSAFAQQGSLKGTIIDSNKQTGLPDVEITDASGKVLTISLNDGTFSLNLPAGRHILYINLTDFDQAVIEADIKAGETVDAGNVLLKTSTGSMQDLFTININEGVEEDGFEMQSVQGVLSSTADVFLSNAAYTFGPLMFRVRGYEIWIM